MLVPLDFKLYLMQFPGPRGAVHAEASPASHTAHHPWPHLCTPLGQTEGANLGSQVGLFQLNAEERNSNLPMAHKDSRDSHGAAFLIAPGQVKVSYWE